MELVMQQDRTAAVDLELTSIWQKLKEGFLPALSQNWQLGEEFLSMLDKGKSPHALKASASSTLHSIFFTKYL